MFKRLSRWATRQWRRELVLLDMPDISKQELAVMNAEMAARIFMHIAQKSPIVVASNPVNYTLTEQEQQALRDISGPADPNIAICSPEIEATLGKALG